jgi:hypothetical protein
MTWVPEASASLLVEAVDAFDRPRVAQLCDELVVYLRATDDYPETEARDILDTLRRKRYFQLMTMVADAFVEAGADHPVVRRQYAQALIDQNHLIAARGVLEQLARNTDGAFEEQVEARGLLGRVYKQMYVRTDPRARRRGRYLDRAVRAYHDVYRDHPSLLWHGINSVALLDRAGSDGVELDGFPDPTATAIEIATDIVRRLNGRDDELKYWDLATALEASIALGRYSDAFRWLDRYVQAPGVDAFELASTLRQLTEVWELDESQRRGGPLVTLLKAALLREEGGQVEIPSPRADEENLQALEDDSSYEALLGDERFESINWFQVALERCRSVARIEDRFGTGIGTGFLLHGPDLHSALPETVFLTNYHVVPEALTEDKAYIAFQGLEPTGEEPQRSRIQEVLHGWGRDELDAVVAVLDHVPPGATTCPVATALPLRNSKPPPRAYVIGHPRGLDRPMLSIHDNVLLDWDDTLVHYRSPTQKGSSGSPVFTRDWDLIALHHYGDEQVPKLHHADGFYPANEGILIDQIKLALAGKYG